MKYSIKSNNGYIYARVTKAMYRIPLAVRIAHFTLVTHLYPYDYQTSSKNLGLWKHIIRPINFTLVVDDFGVKYLGKEHTLHLKSALEYKYKITKDWEGKLYIRIALNQDYEKGTVQLSMSGFIRE